jgi:hypothetical protein
MSPLFICLLRCPPFFLLLILRLPQHSHTHTHTHTHHIRKNVCVCVCLCVYTYINPLVPRLNLKSAILPRVSRRDLILRVERQHLVFFMLVVEIQKALQAACVCERERVCVKISVCGREGESWCVCVCVSVCVRGSVFVHLCTRTCMSVCTRTCMSVYVYVCVYVCVCTYLI